MSKDRTAETLALAAPRDVGISLRGRVVLVTGGAQGIGRAVAEQAHAAGATTLLLDIQAEAIMSLASRMGETVLGITADVTKSRDVDGAVAWAMRQFGRLDVLINAAGVLYPTRLLDISEAEWHHTFAVNVTGVFLMTRAAIPPMRKNGYGRIINVSSTAGKCVSTLGGAHYTASKAAVLGLTRATAKEVAAWGITANAVCPGLIDTEMARRSVSAEQLAAYASSFPIARLGTPEEVADVICFLASERASYITGATVDITGGDLMV